MSSIIPAKYLSYQGHVIITWWRWFWRGQKPPASYLSLAYGLAKEFELYLMNGEKPLMSQTEEWRVKF